MNQALWILQGLLGATVLMSGTLKLVMRRLELARYAAWAKDFSDGSVKLIGLVEVLGAIGLVTLWLLGIARVLTPLAALGLTALMLGAVGTHIKRKDGQFGRHWCSPCCRPSSPGGGFSSRRAESPASA
jgi:uncharacterized membrane protein YphA (DoxX/SURF4 family)